MMRVRYPGACIDIIVTGFFELNSTYKSAPSCSVTLAETQRKVSGITSISGYRYRYYCTLARNNGGGDNGLQLEIICLKVTAAQNSWSLNSVLNI